MDLRQRVMTACDHGKPTAAVAATFGVSPAWVRRLKQHRRARGTIVPRTGGGSRGQVSDRVRLAELVAEQPDATPAELRERQGVAVTLWSVCRALKQLKLTYKKSLQAAEQDRPDVAAARAAWRVSQTGLDPAQLVFTDETWAKTTVTRTRGRAPKGERLVAKVPHGHWHTTTLPAALVRRGVRCSMTPDGPVNADAFEDFVREVLVPTLTPGDVVVLDNLSRATRAWPCGVTSKPPGRRCGICRRTTRT